MIRTRVWRNINNDLIVYDWDKVTENYQASEFEYLFAEPEVPNDFYKNFKDYKVEDGVLIKLSTSGGVLPPPDQKIPLYIKFNTEVSWLIGNPVVESNTFAYATDTGLIRLGDGATPYNECPIITDEVFTGAMKDFLMEMHTKSDGSMFDGDKVKRSILPIATLSERGTVQLSDSVADVSTNIAATANAVKRAYDKGLEALTAATMQGNILVAHLNEHNPHGINKTTVGLGNLPNAKSDAINLDDTNTLATSKAVHTLAGVVDGVAHLNRVQIWTRPQSMQTATLSINGSGVVVWDWMQHQAVDLTMTRNATLQFPATIPQQNTQYIMRVWQDSAGGRILTLGEGFVGLTSGGPLPKLNSAANSFSVFTFIVFSDGMIVVGGGA